MSEVSKILGNLPDGEETHERVAEWLKRRETGQGSEEDNSAGPLEGGQHDSPGESRGKNSKTVSLFQTGEVPPMDPPRRTLLGPTASCSGSKGHKGPTASSSGSCVQSSASQVLESPKGVNLPEAHLLQGKEERGHHLDSVRFPRQNVTEEIPQLTQHQIQASLTQLH